MNIFAAYPKFAGSTAVAWLRQPLGLSSLILFAGCLMAGWLLAEAEPIQANMVQAASVSDQSPISANNQRFPGSLLPTNLDSAIAFGHSFQLGAINYRYPDNQLFDPYGEPVFPPPKSRLIAIKPTATFWGHTFEVSGRAWLVEGHLPRVGGYLKLSLMGQLDS